MEMKSNEMENMDFVQSQVVFTYDVSMRKKIDKYLSTFYPLIEFSLHQFVDTMYRYLHLSGHLDNLDNGKGETAMERAYLDQVQKSVSAYLLNHCRPVKYFEMLQKIQKRDAQFLIQKIHLFETMLFSVQPICTTTKKHVSKSVRRSQRSLAKGGAGGDDDDSEDVAGQTNTTTSPYIQIVVQQSPDSMNPLNDYEFLMSILRHFRSQEKELRRLANEDEDEDDEDDEDEEEDDECCEGNGDDDDDDEEEDNHLSRRKRKAYSHDVQGPLKAPRQSKDAYEAAARSRRFMDLVKGRTRESRSSNSVENSFSKLPVEDQKLAVKSLMEINDDTKEKFLPFLLRILLSSMNAKVREEVLIRYENSKKEEGGKFVTWMDAILRVPFGKFIKTPAPSTSEMKAFFTNARGVLDNAVMGHESAKHKLLQYLGQLVRNPSSNGNVLGIEGPMGVGKTTLIEKGVASILGLPFFAIPLGGASDASFLNGHSYTYEGSVYGQIVDVLIKSKVMNPIIYFDELDKVSETHRGQEIINLLIHMVDPAQNNHFQDRYFGNIDIDLSKCIFIFSYNNASSINPILRDRIFEVKASGFTGAQKVQIAKRHLIPQVMKEVGIEHANVVLEISDEIVDFIIKTYTHEGGVRKLRECILEITRDVNLELLIHEGKTWKSRRKLLPASFRTIEITEKLVREKYLKHRRPVTLEKIHQEATVGRINGLYATSNETGGIIPIEASWLPSDQTMMMSITGNLGKVMTESTQVSRTLAWNLTSVERQQQWLTAWKQMGKMSIHVHCPDGSIEKEGPSAGVALTVALYSLLNNLLIDNRQGVTGEINLSGDVMAIGGLRQKMYGAKMAGIIHVLFPKDNLEDYQKIVNENPDLFENGFTASPISTIQEAMDLLLLGPCKEEVPILATLELNSEKK